MEKLFVELKLNHTHNEKCDQEVYIYMSEDYIGHRLSVTMVDLEADEEDIDLSDRGVVLYDEELYDTMLPFIIPKSLFKAFIDKAYVIRATVLDENDEVMVTAQTSDVAVESSETLTNKDLGLQLFVNRETNADRFRELFKPLNFELDDGYRLVFATLFQGSYVSFCMRDNELEFMVKNEEKFSLIATSVEQLVTSMFREPIVCAMLESTGFMERIFEPKVFSENLCNMTNQSINRLLREQQLGLLHTARNIHASV